MPFFKTENGNAENIKYDDTKSVKEVIDDIKDTAMFIDSFNTDTGTLNTTSESGNSSGNQTASSVTFDNTDTGLEAANVQDAIEEVNGKLDWFDIKSEYGTYTAVGTNNSAEICRLSLTPGTWLLLGYVDSNISKDTVYNNSIFRESLSHHCQTVRSTLIGGGGCVNSYAITVQTNMDMILGTYDNSDVKGNIFRGTLLAIRLLKL